MGHIILGALNDNREYIIPQNATKGRRYECPECKEVLILKQGNVRIHHFSHKNNSTCTYLDKPSESYQHLSAKNIIKYKLQCDTLHINRKCTSCKNTRTIVSLPKCDNIRYSAELEYKFHLFEGYRGEASLNRKIGDSNNTKKMGIPRLRIADVGIVDTIDNSIPYVIEVYHTHKTDKSRRAEPWFEVDARKIISSDIKCNTIECIRDEICELCAELKYSSLEEKIKSVSLWSDKDLEFYVRYKLGQRVFRDNNWSNEYHKRLQYHCDSDNVEVNVENNKLIHLFNPLFAKLFNSKMIISEAWKGLVYVYLIKKGDNNMNLRFRKEKEIYNSEGEGTIGVIMQLIKIIC